MCNTRQKIVAIVLCWLVITSVLWPVAQAGIYSVTLSAPTQTNVGSNYTVYLRANMVKDSYATGYISGTVLFPSQYVKLINIYPVDYPGVTFSWTSNSIKISAPNLGAGKGYGGNLTIFRATFNAIAVGPATISASGGSMIVNGTNHTVISASTNIYAQSCPSGQVGTPPSCTTPAPPTPNPSPNPTTPTSPATNPSTPTTNQNPTTSSPTTTTPSSTVKTQTTTAAPKPTIYVPKPSVSTTGSVQTTSPPGEISGPSTVNITTFELDIRPTKAVLSFVPTAPLHDTTLYYGTDKNDLSMTISLELPTTSEGGLVARLDSLSPSTKYFYRLDSVDADGKQSSYTNSFNSLGFPVKVKVLSAGKLKPGGQIKMGSNPFTADANGEVVTNLPPGKYTITDSNGKGSSEISVKRTDSANGDIKEQSYSYNLPLATVANTSKTSSMFGVVLVLLLLAGSVGGGTVWWRRREQARLMTLQLSTGPSDIDVVTSMYEQATGQTDTDANAPETPHLDGGYHNVSLADMVSTPAPSQPAPDENDDFDPFIQDSPFAPGKDFNSSKNAQEHVEHHYRQ